ncbi:hypothetical protein KKF34_16885 [Myxococcota bacterium]|nr:hypothetical protein [Myxococcota bacterium]MBU1381988.1 hypothetical protein [Myxococcota bacterium]MBU1498555.1 hypothetical protein [Myxococcota bacterium]
MRKIISLVVLLFLSSCGHASVRWENAGEVDIAQKEAVKNKFEDQFSKVKYDTSGIKLYVKYLPPALEFEDNVYRVARGYPGVILGTFTIDMGRDSIGTNEHKAVQHIKRLAAIVGGDIVYGTYTYANNGSNIMSFSGVVIKTVKDVKPVKKVEKTAEEKVEEKSSEMDK